MSDIRTNLARRRKRANRIGWVVVAVLLGLLIGGAGNYLRHYGSDKVTPVIAATEAPVAAQQVVTAGQGMTADRCIAIAQPGAPSSYSAGKCFILRDGSWQEVGQ